MISDLRNVTFLLLDDSAAMAQIVRAILKGLGVVHLYVARDIPQALDILAHHTVDLAIVDYRLEFMDGLEFVRMIRQAADSPNPFLPVIMLTAHTEESRVAEARDSGANEFCAKPITPAELVRKINEVILRPRRFVRTSSYSGPDRRRRADPRYAGPNRRAGTS